MQVLENYTDPAIKNAIYNASIQLGAGIEEDDTAAIRTKESNRQDIEDFKNAWINGDDFKAAQILNSNEHFLEIYPRYDVVADAVVGVQSPDTIARSMGLTRVEPKGGNGGESPNQKPSNNSF
jgi:hypothetical protein